MKSCPICAQPIERGDRKGGPLPTYCSTTCKNQARVSRERVNGITELRRQQAQERRDRERAHRQTEACPYCGTRLANVRRKQCGQAECKKRFNADRMSAYMRERRNADGEVGQRYRQYQRDDQRRMLESRGHWRKRYPEQALRADALRRARLQAALVEAFAPRAVLDRDGWVCRLCLQPIDPAVAWPASLSPSVDHVIPLAKGGLHTMANVQSAHLGCNSRKRDRVGDGRTPTDHGLNSPKITLGAPSKII